VGWFFGGFFLHIVGVVLVAVLSDLKQQRAEREHIEQESRRLREKISQEQVKNDAFRHHAAKRLDIHDSHLGIDSRQANPALPGPEEEFLSLPDSTRVATDHDERHRQEPDCRTLTRPAPPVLPGRRRWHYACNGETVGPVAEGELLTKLRLGHLDGSTLVWTEDMENWKEAKQITVLKAHLRS
jgi:hypothetical protein